MLGVLVAACKAVKLLETKMRSICDDISFLQFSECIHHAQIHNITPAVEFTFYLVLDDV